jgi:hypothetical protein
MWDCFVHSDERRFRGGQGKGQLLDESKGASVWVTGRAGWALGCYYSHYRRPPFRDRILSVSFSWNTFDRYRSGNASYSRGKRAGANYRFLTFDQSLRISEKWTINIGYERLRHEHRTYQLVISGVYDLTPEKSLMFRWVKGLSTRVRSTAKFIACRQSLFGIPPVLPQGDGCLSSARRPQLKTHPLQIACQVRAGFLNIVPVDLPFPSTYPLARTA